jgi:hypothetical protein
MPGPPGSPGPGSSIASPAETDGRVFTLHVKRVFNAHVQLFYRSIASGWWRGRKPSPTHDTKETGLNGFPRASPPAALSFLLGFLVGGRRESDQFRFGGRAWVDDETRGVVINPGPRCCQPRHFPPAVQGLGTQGSGNQPHTPCLGMGAPVDTDTAE